MTGVVNIADPGTCVFRGLNIVIFIDINTLSFYTFNMDVVSLFVDSSFLFLATLNLYYIDLLC